MKKTKMFWSVICALALVFQFVVAARAADSPAAAEQMVAKAIKYYQKNGKAKAIAAFNNPHGQFVKGDLYVFMFNYDGLILAHGTNPKLVGKNVTGLRDANGKAFVQAFAQKAKAGGGWVDYEWSNPITKKIQNKASFIKPIPGTNYYVGCGIYK